MEGQSNYLLDCAKYQFRKIKLLPLLIATFVVFLFAIPYYAKYNEIDNLPIVDVEGNATPLSNDDTYTQNSKCPHYKMMLLISSEMENVEKRLLMREELFGITDNLVPCMKQDTSKIFYKFLVKNKKPINDEDLRNYLSEKMEYNDIVEISPNGDDDWEQTLLKYSQLIKGSCITFDHLVLIDVYTMINLEKLQNTISSSTIANQTISNTKKMVWGSFNSNITDSMAIILGSSAIQPILDHSNYGSKNYTSVISRFYYHHLNHPNERIPHDLILINDPLSIVEWPNSLKSISCLDCIIAIGHVYQDWEIRKIKEKLNIQTVIPCKVRSDIEMYSQNTSKLRPNIAVITSSFLYRDNCMVEAAPISAQNKREYAEKHGYAFVSRSTEFVQQLLRKRKEVWGKIDAVEKVLPYYEWLIWLDMDAIFVNRSLSIEDLLKMCEEKVGGRKEFEKINFIVARPVGDDMINAGVFLIRNSDWARDFIRNGIQARRDRAYRGMKEQQAMRDAIKRPNWKPNVLYLNGDDHTINTFPDRYVRGDYIVHYAPEEGCPADPVLGGIKKVLLLEESPDFEIILPF
ncbi:glycosyltransferase family 34 protein [Rhizophagus clarus]|nr:glycosyltransferase family 34 protein [Rhizophagus clarus]